MKHELLTAKKKIENIDLNNSTLKRLQSLPLVQKINLTERRIVQFYEYFNKNVYVAFSGGKDSTVLLHIIRKIYPEIKAVFVDTGLEFPEIIDFVKTIDNVIWLKPKMNFKKVLDIYGYPVISKMQAQYIEEYRTSKSEKLKKLRLDGKIYNGVKNYNISEKWKYLIDAPFKISCKCCNIMKKQPFKIYEKENGSHPFIGVMASESMQRKIQYLQQGCNIYDNKNPSSRPISFWNENDVWDYIKENKVKYSKIYDMGYKRTGCMFCMYGIQHDTKPNRFQTMKKTHPQIYKYCIEKLGIGNVLDFKNIDYE